MLTRPCFIIVDYKDELFFLVVRALNGNHAYVMSRKSRIDKRIDRQ
jgi:hypothetical protein